MSTQPSQQAKPRAGESLRGWIARAAADALEKTSANSWQKYINPDPVDWIQSQFFIPETGRPLDLHETQIIPLREALSRNPETGLFNYSLVLWGSVKKSAKTTINAAACLWFAWQRPWSSCKVIGNDLKQADSRVMEYIRRAILLHPEWQRTCRVVGNRITLPNRSVIEAIPIDPQGEAGGNDDFVSYTELWGWKNKAALKLWTESTLSPTKYGRSMRWADTYAGEIGEAPVLERIYENIVVGGENINPDLEMYRKGRSFSLWCTKHHLPYHTKEYLDQERENLTESEYSRVHDNQWAASTQSFVPLEWWTHCRAENFPPLGADQPVILIADAAVTHDCFGLLMLSGTGIPNKVAVRYARRWIPPKGGRIYFSDPNGDGPEDEIRRLIKEFNCVELVYDPMHLEDMIGRFQQELLCHTYKFNQGMERAIADKALYDAIRERSVFHSGEPELQEHIQNADQKSEGEKKIRIVKRADGKKIDLCVCLSMGYSRVTYWQL